MRKLLALVVALGACRSASGLAEPTQPSEWHATSGIKPAPCTDAADCWMKGRELLAHDAPEGRERLLQACALGSNEACADHGIACARGRAGPVDDVRARESLVSACARTRDTDACAWLSRVLARSPQRYDDRESVANRGCSTKDVAPENRDVRAEACMLANRTQDACTLGYHPACEKLLEKMDADVLNDGELTVATVKHDGVLFLSKVRCEVPGGHTLAALLRGIDAVDGLEPQRRALATCVNGADARRIAWTAVRGLMTEVSAETSSDSERRCIVRALTGAPAPIPGKCAATIHYGRQ